MTRRSILIAALCFASTAHAAPVALSPGILVDAEIGFAFAVNPEGLTQQIQLRDGSSLWTSNEKAFPIALADDYLIALASTRSFASATLLLMDPNDGEIVQRVQVDLPDRVMADFVPRPERRFKTTVLDTEEGVRVFWQHEYQPLRGEAVVELDAHGNETINPNTVDSGVFDLVPDGDRWVAASVRSAAAPQASTLVLAESERVPGVAGEQYRATDNLHVLTNKARPHASFGQVYQWSVFDREGARVGGIVSPYAWAPYLVSGTQMLLREQPIGYMGQAGQWQERGMRLIAVDLESTEELWSFVVLDPEYRGPLAP